MFNTTNRHITRPAFRVARLALDQYQFTKFPLFADGTIHFQTMRAVRVFAQAMNAKRDLAAFPERAVRAGQINALGLIDEVMFQVAASYCEQIDPAMLDQALAWLQEKLGEEAVQKALARFTDAFPPAAVYRGESTVAAYLAGETDGVANRQLVLLDLIVTWLKNMNPACTPYIDLFDDSALVKETAYRPLLTALHDFFQTKPFFGPDHQNLLDMFRAPAIAVPHSLTGQLEYILQRWGKLLGSKYLYRLLGSLDLIKEEEKAMFFGPGPALVPSFDYLESEPELFSMDKDWMPCAVMMAKNTYVWLAQLSKHYDRPITRLDEIPDEELDRLARWGFTGLWLIGVWERSEASQWIKQRCGNPEAAPSAYSLYDYVPAHDLGGDEALANLRERAWQRGIRLASDMVPNHMGIYSKWVVEHPDWFVGLNYPPFPSYTYNSESLSPDPRIGLYVEDHYYSRSDAAVTFKRVDFASGDIKYIYHGNDGTSMPWNDTAQLDYLNPAVREAVIQTIIHVAKNFPIIRFDAAMTLAKRHFQRLWFPEPGTGGAIPSRAEFGMTKAQFNEAMPMEFWREVVDRVAVEAPDTLLLAEAFWLMEGYFVRTLGMHRVYNSAFMNMLRDEDNANYRTVMKNTLEFDPDILKRYVSFMNNPDERTAVEQFGSGDKYFGICALLATLPGLPMFGHGQIEGYAEKYGMEYRKAYWDEEPNQWLIERHEREIFPLLRRRALFAEVENFTLYDVFTPEGWVNEDVYAYSNRRDDERGLVVFHNKYGDARGWIKTSVGFVVKDGEGKHLTQRTLGEGLALPHDENSYVICRDSITGLEFIRNARDLCERGLYIELHAYQYYAFVDFRLVQDNEWHHFGNLCAYLDGRGVPSIETALRELFLQPVHAPLKQMLNPGYINYLLEHRLLDSEDSVPPLLLDEAREKALAVLREVQRFAGVEGDVTALADELPRELAVALQVALLDERYPDPELAAPLAAVAEQFDERPWEWGVLFGWLFTHNLGKVLGEEDYQEQSRSWHDEWLLNRVIVSGLQQYGLDEDAAWRASALVGALTTHERWYAELPSWQQAGSLAEAWFSDSEVQPWLRVNRHQGILWFNKEAFATWLWWMLLIAAIQITADAELTDAQKAAQLQDCARTLDALHMAAENADYQVDRLLDAAREPGSAV